MNRIDPIQNNQGRSNKISKIINYFRYMGKGDDNNNSPSIRGRVNELEAKNYAKYTLSTCFVGVGCIKDILFLLHSSPRVRKI